MSNPRRGLGGIGRGRSRLLANQSSQPAQVGAASISFTQKKSHASEQDGFGPRPDQNGPPPSRLGGLGRGTSSNRQSQDNEQQGNPVKSYVEYVPPKVEVDKLYDEDTHVVPGIDFDLFDNDERLQPKVTGGRYGSHKLIRTFRDAAIDQLILRNVDKSKFTKLTPIQSAAIPVILAGEDVMACAQTGSGKTAAYLLPMIHWIKLNKDDSRLNTNEPYALIIAPTRELAKQIYRETLKFANGTGVSAVEVYGQTNMWDQYDRVRDGCDIAIASIGRLNQLVRRDKINTKRIKFLVFDEADRMLRHNQNDRGFVDDIKELIENEGMPPRGIRQTLMFSATFPTEVQEFARNYLDDKYVMVHIGKIGSASAQVAQEILEVSHAEKRNRLTAMLTDEVARAERTPDGRFIKKILVFLKTRSMTDIIALWLSDNDIPTTSIHGDRTQEQREDALRQFSDGNILVLTATDVAARGLDIPKVDYVINYDLPREFEQYVHRIGRTGRVGNRGRATSFFDGEDEWDEKLVPSLIQCLAEVHQEVPDWLLRLNGHWEVRKNDWE